MTSTLAADGCTHADRTFFTDGLTGLATSRCPRCEDAAAKLRANARYEGHAIAFLAARYGKTESAFRRWLGRGLPKPKRAKGAPKPERPAPVCRKCQRAFPKRHHPGRYPTFCRNCRKEAA
jgi:hypothetical protein